MPIQPLLCNPQAVGDASHADTQSVHSDARERRHAALPMDDFDSFQASAPAPLLAVDTSSGIAGGDWDDLFNAVKYRLVHIVSESGIGRAPLSEVGIAQVRDRVLECVSALDLLQLSVTAERLRHEGLEIAVLDAQASLAQVRAALVGTQEGERRARHDASHDSLTQLPNRGFLLERIDQQLSSISASEHTFAVMFLDLTGFKLVNDTYGHAVGDKLLHIVAARLRRAVRARDVVSRVGGDEFACMIGGLDDRAQLAHLADKMVQAIEAPCTVGSLKLVVHASIGIATSPVDGGSAKALLECADLAMYTAKRQRAGHAFFSRVEPAATPARKAAVSNGHVSIAADFR